MEGNATACVHSDVGRSDRALKAIVTWLKAATVAKIADKLETMAIIALYAKDFIVSLVRGALALAKNTAAWVAHTASLVAAKVGQVAMTAATLAWNAICAVATTVTTAFGAALAFLTSPIGLVILAIGAVIAIVALLIKNWDDVKAAAGAAWDWIKQTWQKASDWFNKHVVQPLKDLFAGLQKKIEDVWDNIWGSIKGVINKIIDGMNVLIRGLNNFKIDVPDWVPVIGGKKFGFNIQQLPHLKMGTNYVPHDMFAYLHEGEAVVPKKYNPAAAAGGDGNLGQVFKQAMLEALMQRDIIAGGSEGRELRVTMVLDNGEVLADMLIDPMNRTAKNRGFAPVFRPAT